MICYASIIYIKIFCAYFKFVIVAFKAIDFGFIFRVNLAKLRKLTVLVNTFVKLNWFKLNIF